MASKTLDEIAQDDYLAQVGEDAKTASLEDDYPTAPAMSYDDWERVSVE